MTVLRALLAVRLVCADAARLAAFYTTLGFRMTGRAAIPAREMAMLGIPGRGERLSLMLGESRLDLDRFEAAGAPWPADARACDTCFQHFAIRSIDAHADFARALAAGASPISRGGPVRLPPANGSVIAAKLRDPEGHPIEFLQFPEPRPCGIDHSAIAVGDAAASLAFYRAHGLVAGNGTLNRGPAQQHLDRLDNAEVEVLPLLPQARSPHLELLGYRRPAPRRYAWALADAAATRLVWAADTHGMFADPDGHWHQLEAA